MDEQSLKYSIHPAEQAALLFANGEIQRALQIALDAINEGFVSADLCNLAGACAGVMNEQATAKKLWEYAIALAPECSQAWFNLGLLHEKSGTAQDAERCYRAAAEIHGGNAQACLRLGDLLARCGQDEEAEMRYCQAIDLAQSDASAFANLGVLLARQGRAAEAEGCYRRALNIDPAAASTHSNLGILLAAAKRHEEAEQCYRQAITLDPHNADIHTNLALCREARGYNMEAEQFHRRGIELDPDRAEIHSNLGNLLMSLRREEEAAQCHRRALQLAPNSAACHTNLGVVMANIRRQTEAEQCFRRAIALEHDYQLPRLNLAYLLLSQGRFEEGWRLHEARSDPRLPDNGISIPRWSFPRWQGEALDGKSLLVWHEQGFGDAIQFCRYLPLLKQRWRVRITLVCQAPLEALMNTLEGVDEVIALQHATPHAIGSHDYWTLPLSIPFHWRAVSKKIPARLPYLSASLDRMKHWSTCLPNVGLRVGLVWKGNPLHRNDGSRSLPGLACLAPLWQVPGVHFVSLQVGGEVDVQSVAAHQPLLHLGSSLSDFADTAAIIAQLDLVISVDTAAAHLAGALDKPCWVLLPAYRQDWRWLQGRHDSPWYPGSMRLYRQDDSENWQPVIEEIAVALQMPSRK